MDHTAPTDTILELGTARREITPPRSVALAGFAHRRPPNEGVSRPLYVRAWLLRTTSRERATVRTALFVQADLIWWGSDRLDRLRDRLAAAWSIDPGMMLFHASHTHGGPQTGEHFSDVLGRMDAPYMDYLERQVELAVAAAHENVEPVTLEMGTGECAGISINRRRKFADGVVRMAPNPNGVNDRQVAVVKFVARDRRIKGIWFHFTCHPTTTGDNLVTSEYCGAAMNRLDETFGPGVSCFLQGCCGDIRPALIRDDRFHRGGEADVQAFGARLAACVQDILNRPMTRLHPIDLDVRLAHVDLPFQRVPVPEELEPDDRDDAVTEAWKRLMRSGRGKLQPHARLGLQLLRLADDLSLLALDGEVVVEYGLLIKRLSRGRTLPLAYSNGMVGYIPTAAQIREGGYESVDSYRLFGYPSPFAAEAEDRIVRAIRRLLDQP
jgi:hypothetical protein